MMDLLGEYPGALLSLNKLLYGGDAANFDAIDAVTGLNNYGQMLANRFTPGQQLNARDLVGKLYGIGRSPEASGDLTNATLLGTEIMSGTVDQQVNAVNGYIGLAMLDSNPGMSTAMNQLLSRLGNQYLMESASMASQGEDSKVPSYIEWLSNRNFGF
jgi:hypothetical protein